MDHRADTGPGPVPPSVDHDCPGGSRSTGGIATPVGTSDPCESWRADPRGADLDPAPHRTAACGVGARPGLTGRRYAGADPSAGAGPGRRDALGGASAASAPPVRRGTDAPEPAGD